MKVNMNPLLQALSQRGWIDVKINVSFDRHPCYFCQHSFETIILCFHPIHLVDRVKMQPFWK